MKYRALSAVNADQAVSISSSYRNRPRIERTQTHGALAVASCPRLLDALRASDRPLALRELAAAGRATTVRFHLDALTDGGLVQAWPVSPVRGTTPTAHTPGQPRHRRWREHRLRVAAPFLVMHRADSDVARPAS